MNKKERVAAQTILAVFAFDRLGLGTSIREQAEVLAQNSASSHDARSEFLAALKVLAAGMQ